MAGSRYIERRRRERYQLRKRLEVVGTTVHDDELGPKRHRLAGVVSRLGGWVHTESRALQWDWDLEAEQLRLQACEQSWGLIWHPEHGYVARAWPCGSRLCPVCWASRASIAAHRWGPVILAALASGHAAWHIVLTQRCQAVRGSAILPTEMSGDRGSRHWIGVVPREGLEVPAVAGESCLASYERWYGSWRRFNTSRGGRALKAPGVGILRGTEWTLRPKTDREGPWVPRWHCHGHLLWITPADWDGRAVLYEWAKQHQVYGWAPRQRGRQASPGRKRKGSEHSPWRLGGLMAERIPDESGVLEVLKYAFKPGAMTAYGTLDAYAALRGTRTHQVAGGLHCQSRLAREQGSCWAEWLDERPQAEGWSLLQEYKGGKWAPALRPLADLLDPDAGPIAAPEHEHRAPRYRIKRGGQWHQWEDWGVPLHAEWRTAALQSGHSHVEHTRAIAELAQLGSLEDASPDMV